MEQIYLSVRSIFTVMLKGTPPDVKILPKNDRSTDDAEGVVYDCGVV